jgi:hypothetical protein
MALAMAIAANLRFIKSFSLLLVVLAVCLLGKWPSTRHGGIAANAGKEFCLACIFISIHT